MASDNNCRKIVCIPPFPQLPRSLRVAAYARVSLASDYMLHSLSAQISYYNEMIQHHPGWDYAGVYADLNVSGGMENRPEFQRLLGDCRAGKVDMIITKSVSRFSRNAPFLIATVRELKDLGVDVFFEEQNIHSIGSSGELMLSIVAAYAQQELYSTSENIKWRKRHDMKMGKAVPMKMYGFEVVDRSLRIKPDEAAVIRHIAELYMSGKGHTRIAAQLTAEGIPTPKGYETWNPATVVGILENDKLRGCILCQRLFTTDPVTDHQVVNRGELPQCFLENTHEDILTNDEFLAITAERERRNKYGGLNSFSGVIFRRKLICGYCGMVFCHTRNGRGNNVHHVWQCGGRDYRNGKRGICKAKAIPEDLLIEATMKVLELDEFDPELIEDSIDEILVPKHHELVFIMKDGRIITCEWKNKPNGMKEKGLPDQSTLPDLPVAETAPKPFSKLTETDKELIHKWRAQGYEYKRIAAALRRPVSTIRTFCIYAPRERAKKALMEEKMNEV